LGLLAGQLLSEPAASPDEVDLVVDAATSRVLIGHLDWTGRVRSRETGEGLPLEYVNHPPVVPAQCADLVDQTRCTQPGDVVRFTPKFAAATPSGPGVEVVLNRLGCVVRTTADRGTALDPGQTSLQATGRSTVALLELSDTGCLNTRLTVTNETGERLAMRPSLFGVNAAIGSPPTARRWCPTAPEASSRAIHAPSPGPPATASSCW
jgi:hypothetical protein